MKLFAVFALALSLLVCGCSTVPPRTGEVQPSPTPLANNAELKNWQLKGKIGLRGEDFAESAYIHWRHCDGHFAIQLNGPLGSGAVRLQGNANSTTITTSDEVIVTESPEQLLYQRFGWQLPISNLPYWLRGLPAPEASSISLDDTPLTNGFSQDGWQVQYLRFSNLEQHRLPAKLVAQHPQLKVTLIIKNWQLQPECR